MIKIYLVNVKDIDKNKWGFFQSKTILLPLYCQKRLRRNLHESNRNLSLIGWILYLIFIEYRLNANGNGKLKFTQSGKPYLENQSIQFNISHSYPWVCLGIYSSHIGIDVEGKASFDSPLMLDLLSQEERDWVTEKGKDNLEIIIERFRCLWSAKEAWLKYTGVGLKGMGMELPFDYDIPYGIYRLFKEDGNVLYLNQEKVDKNVVLSVCCGGEAYEINYLRTSDIEKFLRKGSR